MRVCVVTARRGASPRAGRLPRAPSPSPSPALYACPTSADWHITPNIRRWLVSLYIALNAMVLFCLTFTYYHVTCEARPLSSSSAAKPLLGVVGCVVGWSVCPHHTRRMKAREPRTPRNSEIQKTAHHRHSACAVIMPVLFVLLMLAAVCCSALVAHPSWHASLSTTRSKRMMPLLSWTRIRSFLMRNRCQADCDEAERQTPQAGSHASIRHQQHRFAAVILPLPWIQSSASQYYPRWCQIAMSIPWSDCVECYACKPALPLDANAAAGCHLSERRARR